MPLNVIIAGAGIAGGATAIAFLNYRHQVTIYERRKDSDDGSHSAIQLQPNGVQVLDQIKALSAVDAVSYNSYYTDFRNYKNGETLGLVDYNRRGGVRLATRGQMRDALAGDAIAKGATVITGVGVQSVEESPQGVIAHLTDGSTVTADLIVGADGSYSKVRRSIFPDYSPAILPIVVHQVQVPIEVITTPPSTGSMDRNRGAFQFWPSPGRAATATPLPGTGLYDVQTIDGNAPLSTDPHPEQRLGWVATDMPRLRQQYASWDPQFRAILDAADRYYKWRLVEVRGVPKWSSPHGRVVLVGDSCHGMKPNAGQGSAMGVEDGAVLAELLSKADASTDLKPLLKHYERIRRPRCELIQKFSDELARGWLSGDPAIIERVKQSVRMMAKPEPYDAATPNMRAPFHHPSWQKWMNTYNAREEVQKSLQAGLVDEPRARL